MSLAEFDIANFVPQMIGGALIGLAAASLLLLNGRILGVSGIVGGMLTRGQSRADFLWRWFFLLGMFAAGVVLAQIMPTAFGVAPFQVGTSTGSTAMLVVAGLLVGFGTRLGSGCTSGHGVCGMARGAPRSIVATLVFMGFGIATVTAIRLVMVSGT